MWMIKWLFPDKKKTEEDYQYDHGNISETYTVEVTDGPTRRTTRDINIKIGPAYLHGDITPRGEACIQTVASARFPGGRGVSYLLINRFAELAQKYGATTVTLGTPVNQQSVDALEQSGENVQGERAALHVYSELGYDVSTRDRAGAASRTPQQLIASTNAKMAGKWTNVDELATGVGSFIEQLLMSR